MGLERWTLLATPVHKSHSLLPLSGTHISHLRFWALGATLWSAPDVAQSTKLMWCHSPSPVSLHPTSTLEASPGIPAICTVTWISSSCLSLRSPVWRLTFPQDSPFSPQLLKPVLWNSKVIGKLILATNLISNSIVSDTSTFFLYMSFWGIFQLAMK